MGAFNHEIEFGVPATAIWETLKEQNTLFPKIMPEAISSIEVVDGAGEPGSTRKIHFVAKPGQGAQFVKEKLVSIDIDNYKVVSEEVEGGHKQEFGFTKWVYSLKFVPVSDTTSKLEFSVEYEGASESDAAAAITQTKEGLNRSFKVIEEYVKSSA